MCEKYIDRKIIMVLSFRCCMKRNRNEVDALDANKLIRTIFEKKFTIETLSEVSGIEKITLCKKLCGHEEVTIGDSIILKEILGLTNIEAVDLFLS